MRPVGGLWLDLARILQNASDSRTVDEILARSASEDRRIDGFSVLAGASGWCASLNHPGQTAGLWSNDRPKRAARFTSVYTNSFHKNKPGKMLGLRKVGRIAEVGPSESRNKG